MIPRPVIHFQPEDIWAGVVPDDIEVELAFGDLTGVEFGGQDALAPVAGSGENTTERIDDDAAAADEVVRLAGGEDEATPFERDVAHGDGPALAVVDGGGAIELD